MHDKVLKVISYPENKGVQNSHVPSKKAPVYGIWNYIQTPVTVKGDSQDDAFWGGH